MKTGIIVQARTGSTRMPNKVLLPFYGDQCILDIILQKLKTLNFPITVATSDKEEDNKIVELAQKHNIDWFQGSESNVLQRFIKCAEEKRYNHIVRVCADNPFIDINLIKELVREKADYTAHFFEEKPSIKTHWGIFAELVNIKTLKKIQSSTEENTYLEHVTNYIYEHSSDFQILKLTPPSICLENNLRLTVDTNEDFMLAKALYTRCIVKSSNFSLSTIVDNISQEMKNRMGESIANNQK